MTILKPINCWLVVYPGGARGDFVVGWLGTLPNFINARWHIDIETGKSFSDIDWFRELSTNKYQTAERILNNYNLTADKNCSYNLAAGFHAAEYVTDQIDDNFNILTVEVKEHNYKKCNYEYIIKNNTIKNRSYNEYMQGTSFLTRDNDAPLIDYQKFYKQESEHYKSIKNKKVLEYDKLFQKDGSRYLCNVAGLEASDRHHEYWNTMLEFSESI